MTEKRFNVFDVDGTVFLEDHKEGSYHIGEKENVDIHCLNDIADRLNTYADENEELNQSLLSTSKELQYGVKKVQKLAKENEQLKQALKNSYINEICENCKYGNYFLSDNFDGGFEGDFECLKKHFDNEHWKCDGLKECDDFELDFKGDVE